MVLARGNSYLSKQAAMSLAFRGSVIEWVEKYSPKIKIPIGLVFVKILSFRQNKTLLLKVYKSMSGKIKNLALIDNN